MRPLRSLLAGVIAPALLAITFHATPAVAQDEGPMPHEYWSFENLFGTFDQAALQRGFQVYKDVCSNCHSMQYLHYRVAGLGTVGVLPAAHTTVGVAF